MNDFKILIVWHDVAPTDEVDYHPDEIFYNGRLVADIPLQIALSINTGDMLSFRGLSGCTYELCEVCWKHFNLADRIITINITQG